MQTNTINIALQHFQLSTKLLTLEMQTNTINIALQHFQLSTKLLTLENKLGNLNCENEQPDDSNVS